METLQELGLKPLFTVKLNKTQTKFVVSSGSIIDFKGEAIVNAANTGCLGGDGIDGAINARGGTELRLAREALPEITDGVRCPEGESRVTIAGGLPSNYIIHAVGPKYPNCGSFSTYDSVLSRAYQNALVEGQKKGMKTIAFSLLSTGILKGGRSLEDILLIGVETVVQCVYNGLEEVHMVASAEPELKALLRIAEDFFNKQGKKLHARSNPGLESQAKRQKMNVVLEASKEAHNADETVVVKQAVNEHPNQSCGKCVSELKTTLGPAQSQSVSASLSTKHNVLGDSIPKDDVSGSMCGAMSGVPPVRPTPGDVPVPSQQSLCSQTSTPVHAKTISQDSNVQATPNHIKRSHRIQILLLTLDEWFEHIFKKYLDNHQKILKCFTGAPLTSMQQRHILNGFKTIYPQLRLKLRSNMNSWVESRNLVQLFADVDKMIATQCATPGGSKVQPPVETAAHLQANYELKVLRKVEKELDEKISESDVEIKELEKTLQESNSELVSADPVIPDTGMVNEGGPERLVEV